MRAEIEERFDMDALDIYGLSEVIGPGVANECIETKDGLHIWEDHFYPEIVDPATGELLPDGERGELVLTSLTKEAMPVIRYRTRDLTRLLPGTARTMRRMEKITGRSDDMLIIRGVNLFPTPDRGADPGGRPPRPALPAGGAPRAAPRPAQGDRRGQGWTPRTRPRAKPPGATSRATSNPASGSPARSWCRRPGEVERSLGKAKRILDLRPKD